eukprot:4103315-Amphidinium_carterae.1
MTLTFHEPTPATHASKRQSPSPSSMAESNQPKMGGREHHSSRLFARPRMAAMQKLQAVRKQCSRSALAAIEQSN